MRPGRAAEVVQELFDALSAHDRDALRSTLTDDFRYRDWDRDGFVEIEFAYLGAFPDLRYRVDEIVEADDRVTSRWRFQGTHRGDDGPGLLSGFPATGIEVDIDGIALARVEDGLIAEWWGQWNSLGLHQALGIVDRPQPRGGR